MWKVQRTDVQDSAVVRPTMMVEKGLEVNARNAVSRKGVGEVMTRMRTSHCTSDEACARRRGKERWSTGLVTVRIRREMDEG